MNAWPQVEAAGPRRLVSLPAADAETLVQRHLLGVWRYLRMLGCPPDLADDLAQDAFVTAWEKDAQDLEPAAHSAFLRRTARFLYLRSRHGRRALPIELADAVDLLWQEDCSEDDGDALLDALRRCVAQLTGRPRTVIDLTYRRGHSRQEVASAMDMKENGVKTLLQRTRQSLRECVRRVSS